MDRYPYGSLLSSCYSLGLQPSEARSMSPTELGNWFNSNRPKQVVSGMTEDQINMLIDEIEKNPEEYD